MTRPSRARMALVVVGGTLAILGLVLLQVLLPVILGSWGLVALTAVDVAVYLAYRHRRAGRRLPSGYVLTSRGLEEGQVAQRRARERTRRNAGTVAVVLFVLGLTAAGWIAQADAMVYGSEPGLYFLGAVLYFIGGSLVILLFGDYFARGWRAIQLEKDED